MLRVQDSQALFYGNIYFEKNQSEFNLIKYVLENSD